VCNTTFIMARVLFSFCLLAASAWMAGCAQPTESEDPGTGTSDLTGDEVSVAAIKKAVANLDEEHVSLPADLKAPNIDASTGAESDDSSLFGIDWYQKWGGGKSAAHVWQNGSDFGKRCAWASVARYELLLKSDPTALAALRTAQPKWDGNFTNWNDDYAGKSADGKAAIGDAKEALIKTTGSGNAKWVSATAKDGSCYLPTMKMLQSFIAECKDSMASCESK
jgi:hypothetical protein